MRTPRTVILLILTFVHPCVYSQSSGSNLSPTPAEDASKAMVYFYRYKQFIGYRAKPSVYCDEARLAKIENGRFFAVRLDPGKHTFRANDKQSGVELDVKAGQVYYVRVEIIDSFLKQYGRLVLMAPEQGAYEVKKLKPLGAENVRDKTRVVVEDNKKSK
jgi:hypothetical protein